MGNPSAAVQPPDLAYLPPLPRGAPPEIGLIGCGGITEVHLRAYRQAGWPVTALCDLDAKAAEARRKGFYPRARVTTDHHEILANPAIGVVDIATHPEARGPLIEDALRAGKHVLSQKPFVTDLEEGERLADLADELGLLLAVNQNARWAPHFAYLREAARGGLIGCPIGVHAAVHWDHSWVENSPFNEIEALILYDFGIHWFDFIATVMQGQEPRRVYASSRRTPYQTAKPPLLAQAVVEYDHAQATLVFDGNTPAATWDATVITGEQGIVRSEGVDIKHQSVRVSTARGVAKPRLKGKWFPDGFRGAMGELLQAIEQGRQPSHNARDNLASLELCFAAVESANTGRAVVPGSIRRLPKQSNA
ncbi:MAG: Gfo/Idh/MocA family oxidoreductase [Planctomycetota bacterium]